MIKYALKCERAHQFDVWFRSGEDCDRQLDVGQVVCPECASAAVAKSVMAPRINAGRETAPSAGAETASSGRAAAPTQRHAFEMKLRALRRYVEANADHVGRDFAAEARRMHEGEIDSRPIYGEATPGDVAELLDDGAPVAPIPWIERAED